MKAIIIFCSKTGCTEKVAAAIQRGLDNRADMLKLDLTPTGIMQSYSPSFTLDLATYDLIVMGAWTMVMRVHPFLTAYIKSCSNIEGKQVAGFMTGGAIFSRGHATDDFRELIESRGATLSGFRFITTALGPLLTKKKLGQAEQFARDLAANVRTHD
ncbi:MAG: hypothetical protein GY868_16630 [Deltaproteobacteria bacterium]|nr:hypothetical protein [Deltaproteobacteria bacterium]